MLRGGKDCRPRTSVVQVFAIADAIQGRADDRDEIDADKGHAKAALRGGMQHIADQFAKDGCLGVTRIGIYFIAIVGTALYRIRKGAHLPH